MLNLMSPGFGMLGGYWFLFYPIMIWSLAWKGMALWKAARSGSQGWFIALLVINTAGILEILYIYVITKKTEGTSPTTPSTPTPTASV